jgi:hypothetical protein
VVVYATYTHARYGTWRQVEVSSTLTSQSGLKQLVVKANTMVIYGGSKKEAKIILLLG